MERTTLTIPQELRKEINQYDGKNDKERLLNWAEQKEPEQKNNFTTPEKVREIVREVLMEDIKPNALK